MGKVTTSQISESRLMPQNPDAHIDYLVTKDNTEHVDNATTGEQVIPLGTGSVETTRLSYDKDGNYFKFYMSTLATKEVYKVVFFFEVDGQLQRLDEGIRFKVI